MDNAVHIFVVLAMYVRVTVHGSKPRNNYYMRILNCPARAKNLSLGNCQGLSKNNYLRYLKFYRKRISSTKPVTCIHWNWSVLLVVRTRLIPASFTDIWFKKMSYLSMIKTYKCLTRICHVFWLVFNIENNQESYSVCVSVKAFRWFGSQFHNFA